MRVNIIDPVMLDVTLTKSCDQDDETLNDRSSKRENGDGKRSMRRGGGGGVLDNRLVSIDIPASATKNAFERSIKVVTLISRKLITGNPFQVPRLVVPTAGLISEDCK